MTIVHVIARRRPCGCDLVEILLDDLYGNIYSTTTNNLNHLSAHVREAQRVMLRVSQQHLPHP